MLSVFVEVLVPVFLIVGTGYVVARRFSVTPVNLTTLAYWVLGPVFIFSVLVQADVEAGEVGRIVGATVTAMVGVSLLAALAARVFKYDTSKVRGTMLTSTYSNVGNFGLAISAFALGEEVLPIAGVILVIVNVVGIALGVGLAARSRGSYLRALRSALLSPLTLAVFPALVVKLVGIDLPLWLGRPIELVAPAMIPVMLLTLGIQIAGMGSRLPSIRIALPIAMKLVVAPALAALAVLAFGLTGLNAQIVVLMLAMPTAVFTSLIALEYDFEADYITQVVLVGTLVSALTLPVVIGLL